jgi:hypothetical protein
VNLASRLEGANKYYGTSIIIDAGTRDLLGKSIAVRELDVIKVMGSDDPVRIFEVQALLDDQTARQKEIADGFASAIADYRAGRFEAARIAFEVLAAAPLEDAVSEIFARRCADFEADAPEGWNGVYVMDRK